MPKENLKTLKDLEKKEIIKGFLETFINSKEEWDKKYIGKLLAEICMAFYEIKW